MRRLESSKMIAPREDCKIKFRVDHQQDHSMPTPFSSFSSLSLSKSGRNVANPEDASEFARRLVRERLSLIEGARARSVERWVETSARKHWIKSAAASPVSEAEALSLLSSGKTWAMTAFASGNLVRIELGEEAWQEALGIVDFFLANDGERIARLAFGAAAQKAKQWHDSFAHAKATQEDPDGIEPYADAGDGMIWVEVKSAASLSREGALMRHCVGSYAKQVQSSACKIFSLRDAKNQPRLTVEINGLNASQGAVGFGEAVAAKIAQIRGKANSMPGIAHAGAIRALAAKMAELGLPIQKASELSSAGLELRSDTGELVLFEELEEGYVIKGVITFRRRLPLGLDRLSFTSRVTISAALLPPSLSLDARELVLEGCSGHEITVKNRRLGGEIKVLGVENFGSASFDAFRVDLTGLSKQSNWKRVLGASATGRSMLGAVLGAGARPDKISVSAAEGLAQGVLARRLEVNTAEEDGRYLMERCSFESSDLSAGVLRVDCIQVGQPIADVVPQNALFIERSQLGDVVEGFIDAPPTHKLSSSLLARARQEPPAKAKALVALSDHVSAVDSYWMATYPAGLEMMAIQGNLVVFSVRELARRESERLSLAYAAISELPTGLAWVEALAGELDPGSLPPREAGAAFSGSRFSLAGWAAEFKRRFPSLAADFIEGKGLGAYKETPPDCEAREMLLTLARGRVKLGREQAYELWRMAGGHGKAGELDFLPEAEDKDLAEHGPWRSVASLGFAAMPNAANEVPNEDVVLLDSILGKAIASLSGIVSRAALNPDGQGDDADAVANERIVYLGIMALLWPLADVEVASPEAPPATVLAVAGERKLSVTPFAAAAMGAATAKGLGDIARAPALAAHWAKLIGTVFGDSQSEIESHEALAREAASGIHDHDPTQGASLLEEAAWRSGHELAMLEAEDPGVAKLARSERERLWAGADLTALACDIASLAADAELVDAVNMCAQWLPASSQSANPFIGLGREELISRMSSLSSHSLASPREVSLAISAAAPFIQADFDRHGFLGEMEGELPKTDTEWVIAATLGCFPSAMVGAIDSARRKAILKQPSLGMLGLLDENFNHLDNQGQHAMVSKEDHAEISEVREAIKSARAAQSSWPAASMPHLTELPASILIIAKALIAGSKQELSAGEAIASLEEGRKPWRFHWKIESRKRIAVVACSSKKITEQARIQLVDALVGADIDNGMKPCRVRR